MNQKIILFVCTRNASRSQMAEAFFNFYNTNQEYTAKSAGVQPASKVNPAAVDAMKEKNIDMASHYPKMLTLEMIEEAYKIIRLCGKDACVWAPEEKTEDWDLEDPLWKPIGRVREIRDIIEDRVISLVRHLPPNSNSVFESQY